MAEHRIHPSSVVAPGASIAEDVIIGPFCTVGAEVVLGAGVELVSHVAVAGRTEIGARTRIVPFASIGHEPQDKKFHGEASRLVIGEDNVIREGVTMNPGTEGGGMLTRIGHRGLFMAGAHVAHDCQLGDDVIMANNATLAGHVTVGNFAVFGGLSAVHQFCRIGDHAIIGGLTGVERDVIPYAMAMGDRARLVGLNLRGLRRRNFSKEDIQAMSAAYEALFASVGTMAERLEGVATQYAGVAPVMEIITFIRADSSRAFCQPEAGRGAG
jgi:UDP-N-acetylglucosamine acyltransferase